MRILVVGFYQEETMAWYLKRALQKRGLEVDHFCHRSFSQWVSPSAFISIGFRHTPLFKTFYHHTMNASLLKKVARFKPDLVIVQKGETLFPEAIKKIKQSGAMIINWFNDPIITLHQAFLLDSIGEYDYFIVKDRFIEMRLKELGFDNVRFLHQGFDPDVYQRLELSEEDRKTYSSEIAHVGNIYPYRLRLLSELKGYNLKVWGSLIHVRRKTIPAFYQGRRAISHEKAKIFNAAKIAFNSHSPYEVMGTNVRLFEIAGCGAFQLVDRTRTLDKIFKVGKEIVCYENKQELKELVDYYLENEEERRKIADRCLKRAHRDHTYDKRLQQLSKIIGEKLF